MAWSPEATVIMQRIVSAADTDILMFNAPIKRPQDRWLIEQICARERRPNLLMILVTNGGDPDAAYRIARCIQNHYTKFTVCVSGLCKSAGTLLLLGAHELAFSQYGELGPLDIQMAKKDDLWDSESGLTVMTALSALHENTLEAFEHFLLSLVTRSRGRITVRTASDIAAKLTQALFAPISEQIDPIHMGEVSRSMAIAREYGTRLMGKSENFDNPAETLKSLISDYPSHGFVIDKEEAAEKFKNVRDCTADELALLDDFELFALRPNVNHPWVRFVSDDILEERKVTNVAEGTTVLEQPGVAGTPAAPAASVPTDGKAATAKAGS